MLSNKDIPADKERAVLELVRELKHPNIVELLSAFRQGNDSNLIFPLADMNLREFLEGRKECQMEIHEIYTSIHGLADALRQIHDFFLAAEGNSTSEIRKIGCHHDLRPNNILVQHGVFVIADFGLSKLAPDNEDSKTPLRGLQSDDYLPPEATHDSNGCRRTGSVGRASDNWAFGCILTELATFIEGKNVDDFMESRKVTIRGIYEETNTVFHFNGRVRPAVEKWLDVLEEQPRDRQTTRLIKVARRLMDPDVNKRAKASEVVSDLKVLAIESTYNAIRRAFLNTLEEPGKTFMCLEQMRVQTWWREYHIYELNNTEGDVLSRLQNLERCLRPNTVAELPQSMLSGLPQNILNSVDALCAMLQDEKRRNFASSWCQTVSDIDDTKILSAIRQAPKGSRYREVGISATMKEMNLAVQDSMKEMDLTFQNPKDLRQGSRILKRELIELDDELPFMSNPVEGRYPDKSKTMGYFDTQKENQEGDERVLIEWKEYRGDWKGHGKKQLSSMDRLTDLLDPDVTPLPPAMKSKVLACRGYFHEEHNQRFGFVYSLPATDGDYAAKLFSLNDVLYLADEKNSKLPDLGGIFQLAKDLGSCLLQVHEAGWLHKNISSHNLLIFTPNKDLPNQNVRSAVLCGFNDSRLEAAGYTLGPEGESRHYKYPAYIKDVTFSRAFDYYSLGIVLLEMGLSTTMARLIQRDDRLKSTQGFWQRLLESYVPQLGGEMGSLFMDAVQFCLNAYDYGLAEEHPRELHEKFRKEVVESLALCVA